MTIPLLPASRASKGTKADAALSTVERVLPLCLQTTRHRMSTLMPCREPLTDAVLERLDAFLNGLKNPQR